MIMDNKFDVIIVGAGPAGLKCAHQFKNSELSVLLVEKNKVIGPKVCAGGLTNLSARFDFPKPKMRDFTNQTFYLSGKKYEINLAYSLRTIDRYDLGQYLLNKIKDSKNITILNEVIAKQVEKDKIITNKGEFYYKYLVGADGSNSGVRKFLGLKSEISIGLRYKIPKITDEIVCYLYPKLLGPGYIWIFPHKDYTNAGVYFDPKYCSLEKAKEILENVLERNGFIYPEESFGAAPLNYLYKGCIFRNIFLIGDAAGLVSKTTGEGISPALISGEEVGKKILNQNYKMVGVNKILKIKKKQESFKKIADEFPFIQKYFLKIFINLMRTKWFQLYFGGQSCFKDKRPIKLD